jgi:hypothetical protein
MARGGQICRPKFKPKTPSSISLLRTKNGLDDGVHFTLQGIEAVNMMRKGRIRWVAKEDPAGQARFVGNLFGIAA